MSFLCKIISVAPRVFFYAKESRWPQISFFKEFKWILGASRIFLLRMRKNVGGPQCIVFMWKNLGDSKWILLRMRKNLVGPKGIFLRKLKNLKGPKCLFFKVQDSWKPQVFFFCNVKIFRGTQVSIFQCKRILEVPSVLFLRNSKEPWGPQVTIF